ncbi:MAG: OsmC family protein [Candidatus Altiarchaeota archaeon]
MKVTFPGGMRVDVEYKGYTIATDQPKPAGDGSAPSPFDLFLASICSCAGFYALNFCKARKISTEGMALSADFDYDGLEKRIARISIELKLPGGFPKEYRDAIVRAMESCTVKKVMQSPPEFEVSAR